MISKKVISILCTTLICVVMLTGCGNNKTNNVTSPNKQEVVDSSKKEKISVYLSGPDQMVKKLEQMFEKERGDVLDIYHTGCGPLRQKVWTEMEAGQIQADVVWGSDPLMYIALKEKNKLQQYKSTQIEFLKDEYKTSGEDYYTFVNSRYATIIYNKSKVKDSKVPKSFAAFKEKEWKGRIGIADATQSSTALAITSGLFQLNASKGLDYFKALKSNNVLLSKQNGAGIAKVDQGEIDAAIAPHDEALRIMKKAKKENIKSDLAISWPIEGAIKIERPIAIIKNEARSKEKDKLSKEFVDFILSKQAQQVTAEFGFISVRNDIEAPVGIPKDIKFSTINWSEASKNEKKLREEYSKIMFEN